MNSRLSLKNLPCVVALLTLISATREVDRFYFELNNLIKNQDVVLDWHFNDGNRRQFKFFCCVTNEDQSEYYYVYEQNYDLRGASMPFSSTFLIPSRYTNVDKLHLFFGVVSTTSDSWGDYVYQHQNLGHYVSKYDISGSTSVDSTRYHVYSDIYGVNKFKLYYTFEYQDDDRDSFSLRIEDWVIRFIDGRGETLPLSCQAELRLLDHLKNWAIGTRVGGDYGYVSIPMVLEKDEVEDGYRIYTRGKYAFDKNTGQMLRYSTKDPSTYFWTRSIFACGFDDPADRDYHYQILLNDVNGGDQFMIDKTIHLSGNHFGNCYEADYCVVIGGK